MTLEQLSVIQTLRARWRVVALTCAAIVMLALVFTLALPARYEATASVLVEMSGLDPIRGQALYKPEGLVSTYTATQVEVIRSEQVALGALRSLGLHQSAQWQAKWRDDTGARGDFEAWVAAELLRKLVVRPSRDANVINLSYTSPDPAFSAAVANAFIQSYVDSTVRMQAGPARLFHGFFEERAKPLREALEQARERLSAYEKRHGLLVGEGEDVESARLSELTSQLVALQAELANATNRGHEAASAPGLMEELRRDPEVLALTTELARQQARLSELRSGFGEQHPAVVEARESVRTLGQRVEASMRRAAGSLEANAKVITARLAAVRAAVEEQRGVVLKRKSQRDAAAALVRDVDNAQRAYDAVLARASQTALEGANTTQASVAVLKAATPPPSSSSLLVLNLSVALLLGLLAGIARALYAESRDRRLRTVEDVTDWLQQPLLLALPDARARRRSGERRSLENRQRLVPGRSTLAAS